MKKVMVYVAIVCASVPSLFLFQGVRAASLYEMPSASAQKGVGDTNLTNLIDTLFLKPLISIHDPAFFVPDWKYELIEKPAAGKAYYLFELREFKMQFIVAKFDFRVYPKTKKIEIMNREKTKFIDVKEWLKDYKIYYEKFGKTKRGC